jgi:DNA-binding CsgD family transcriptional regulator
LEIAYLSDADDAPPLHDGLADLIGAIAFPTFEHSMLEYATRKLCCTHLTAFAWREDTKPRVLMAVDRGRAHVARRIAAKYIRDYWELDPANRALGSKPRLRGGATMRIQYEEIENPAYRRDCYSLLRLVDRYSIVKKLGKDLIRLNFYRNNSRGRFADAELKALTAVAGTLIQIVLKHDALRPAMSDEDRLEVYLNRLNSLSLSVREAQVCAEIVLGRSSEAIATTMGLSINTILTHRKHAYSKLGISSQSELSRIVLQ